MLSATFGNASDVGFSVTTGNAPVFPVPVSAAVCGLPLALSVTVIVAVRVPVAVGENVTAMLQLKFGSSGLMQLLVCPKSPASAAVIVMLLMVRFAFPLLVRFRFCAALVVPMACVANVRVEGVRLTSGTLLVIPVPFSVIVRGLPGALSVMVRVEVRAPAADGVNVILNTHDDPGETWVPVWQELPDSENSASV